MNLLTVIGIGSNLYRDDGIGNTIVQTLSRENTSGNLRFLICETDIDCCLSQLNTPYVVLVDAVKTGGEPGSLRVWRLSDLSGTAGLSITMHNQHLLDCIKSQRVYGLLIGIEPDDLSFGTGLSDALRNRYDGITNEVKAVVADYYKELQP